MYAHHVAIRIAGSDADGTLVAQSGITVDFATHNFEVG